MKDKSLKLHLLKKNLKLDVTITKGLERISVHHVFCRVYVEFVAATLLAVGISFFL